MHKEPKRAAYALHGQDAWTEVLYSVYEIKHLAMQSDM